MPKRFTNVWTNNCAEPRTGLRVEQGPEHHTHHVRRRSCHRQFPRRNPRRAKKLSPNAPGINHGMSEENTTPKIGSCRVAVECARTSEPGTLNHTTGQPVTPRKFLGRRSGDKIPDRYACIQHVVHNPCIFNFILDQPRAPGSTVNRQVPYNAEAFGDYAQTLSFYLFNEFARIGRFKLPHKKFTRVANFRPRCGWRKVLVVLQTPAYGNQFRD